MKIGEHEIIKHLGTAIIEGEIISYHTYKDQLKMKGNNIQFFPMPDGAEPLIYKQNKQAKINLGIKSIISFGDLIDVDKKFKPSPEILVLRKKGFEFYRVVLVAAFSTEEDVKFSKAKIQVEIKTELDIKQANIHSTSPRINSKKKIEKTYVLGADAKIFDILNVKGSYTDKRTYHEIHQLIEPHYAAKQDATWKFSTNDMVKEISGTQVVEFVVKQKKDIISEWNVKPDGKLSYEGNPFISGLKNIFGNPDQPDTKKLSFEIPVTY